MSETCAICFDKPANCCVNPCGHQCGCEDCLKRIIGSSSASQKRCPICRANIVSILKIIPSGIGGPDSGSSTRQTTTEPKSPTETSVGVKSPFELKDIKLEVLPIDINENNISEAVVRIDIPEQEQTSLSRLPVDIVTVIDISGSMGTDATYEVNGQERSDGLSILNVCAHAVKVIVASLKKEDRFSLVTFDQAAELKFPLTNITPKGGKDALKAASELRERGSTNLWAGISKGMDSLRLAKEDEKNPKRNKVVLLLTDGKPTCNPKGGHVNAFKEYCRKNKFQCQLSCFGFGYSLDSKLLLEMAEVGGGTFAFIPTAPVLGTVFIHALASVLSTYSTNSKLTLKALQKGGGEFIKGKNISGGLEIDVKSVEEVSIELGPLLFGQTRDIVIPMKFAGIVQEGEDFLEAELVLGKKVLKATGNEYKYDTEAEVAKLRAVVSDKCREVVDLGEKGKLSEASYQLKMLGKLLKDSNDAYDERVVGLHKDVSGRVSKALDGRPRFNRWGKHYIRALLRAHTIQQCTNKLDFGVQVYGGTLFALMRQRGDSIFLKLPAPVKPHPKCPMCERTFTKETIVAHTNRCMDGGGGSHYGSSSTYTAPTRPPSPVSMNTYTTEGGGCFSKDSTVNVICEGKINITRIADVKSGDIVKVAGNGSAKVVCVVKAKRTDPTPLVAIPGGPCLTAKHPVKVDGEWRMPKGLGPMVGAGGDGTVYNFVLEPTSAILIVNGFECVTLGHGLKGKGVEHGFYGSQKVLNEVKKLSGWMNGSVTIGGLVRDSKGHSTGFSDVQL